MIEQSQTTAPTPVRSPTRTRTLWWIAAIGGLVLSGTYHFAELFAPASIDGIRLSEPSIVMIFVDVCLGVLALALLPAALTHDPMEAQEAYVGPPSALVAGLVVLSVWLVSVMAAPAGAIALISISSRLSAGWTIPAVLSSLLSIIVYELTLSTEIAGVQWSVVGIAMAVTLALVGVGSVRGVVARRNARRER
jgi:hypothetical protein